MTHARFLLLVLHLSVAAHAESLESHYLQVVSHATSPTEVERLKEEYDRLRIARTACQIQLSENTVPVACYEQKHWEDETGLREIPDPRPITRLDRLCAVAAERLRLEGGEGRFISPTCAKKIRAAQAIQAYRDEDTSTWSKN